MLTTCVIIGAGHAGLAMSHRLSERSIDHVVLERGRIANSWHTQRWSSLRLLTPNWHLRLPGAAYQGDDPGGFMGAAAVGQFIQCYATSIGAPVVTEATVSRVTAHTGGYAVTTNQGTWTCAAVVIASGMATVANTPPLARAMPPGVACVTPVTYRSPDQLDDRGVLVVGASATGVQLADEIHRSGRPVTLAVGEQVRMPRTYRGRDIFWWLDAAGVLDERFDEVDDIVRARRTPSPQLIGSLDRRSVDLNSLRAIGVDVVGRLGSLRDGVAQFSGGLANTCQLADLKMDRLLDRLDAWAARTAADIDDPPHRFAPITVPEAPDLELDLRRRRVGTVVWATGFRPDLSWLQLPVFDHAGRLRHHGGAVTNAPGMYVLGANLLRTRRSSYVAGSIRDTDDLADQLRNHLDRTRSPAQLLATG